MDNVPHLLTELDEIHSFHDMVVERYLDVSRHRLASTDRHYPIGRGPVLSQVVRRIRQWVPQDHQILLKTLVRHSHRRRDAIIFLTSHHPHSYDHHIHQIALISAPHFLANESYERNNYQSQVPIQHIGRTPKSVGPTPEHHRIGNRSSHQMY